MDFLHVSGFDVQLGKNMEFQAWVRANKAALAKAMPKGNELVGIYASIMGSEKNSGSYKMVIRLDSYGAMDNFASSEGFCRATDHWPGVARQLGPFLVSPRKGTKRRRPDIPEFPKIEPAGRVAKNSPRLAVFNWIFVGGTQTPSPLVRPAGPIFGGAVRGESQNQGGDDWPKSAFSRLTRRSHRLLVLLNESRSLVVSHIRIIRPEKPNESDFLSSDFRT